MRAHTRVRCPWRGAARARQDRPRRGARPAAPARHGDRGADPRRRCPVRRCSSFEDLQWADDVSLEIIAELARQSRDRTLLLTGDYRTEDVPRGTNLRQWRSRLHHPADRRGGPARPARCGRDGARDDPDPRHRAAGAARRRGRRLRAHRRDPAPHRGAARCAQRRGARRRDGDPRGRRPRDDRGRRHRPDLHAVPGGAGDRPSRRRHRPLLRPGRPGRDHGRAARARSRRRSRSSSTSSSSTRPGSAGCTTSATSSCATRCTGRSRCRERRRYHARAGEFGARLEGASEIHASVHYERAGLRREAFDAALAGAREAARLSARREAFELYHRAVNNMPDDSIVLERAAILEACADQALSIEEHEVAESLAEPGGAGVPRSRANRPARSSSSRTP